MTTRRAPARKTATPAPRPVGEATAAEGYQIIRYARTRHFALYDEQGRLVAVMVYRKGASAVQARLEIQAQTIADQQRQIDTLTALVPQFRAKAQPAGDARQLWLFAAEDQAAYAARSGPTGPAPSR